MISTVEITVPPLGQGYQIVSNSTYITNKDGIIVEPQEYYVVQSPTINPPEWYVDEPIQSFVPPIEIPQKVTMRQARLALMQAGLLTLVDNAIETLEEPLKTQVKIEWEYSAVIERNSALVQQMATSLGLDSNQLDQLFLQANTL